MKPRSIYIMPSLGVALLTGVFAVSCSGDKTESIKERYSSYQDRRANRIRERQEKTDRWFDRRMGVSSQNDTGLKLPD